MLRRVLATLVFVVAVGGVVLAEDTTGAFVKFEDGTLTIRTGGGFGQKGEEKTFKIGKDVKIERAATKTKDGKETEAVKLTMDELKTAAKVTNLFVTVSHDGDTVTALTTGRGFGGG